MTRAECFSILQLPEDASLAEIRRQYKKLALQLHPDLNPDPKAHEAFIRLTKAVELLTNPNTSFPTFEKKPGSRSSKNETVEQQFERMKEAKLRFEQQRKKQYEEDTKYYNSLTKGIRWRIFKAVVIIGVVISFVLSLETVLPRHYEKDELVATSKSQHNGIFYSSICAIKLKKRGVYYAKVYRAAWNLCYTDVIIETSWITHTPMKMLSSDDQKYYRTRFDFHVGSLRWLIVITFLLPLYPFFVRRRKISFVFFYQFSLWFIGALELYFLATQDRVWHLLTLGFL